MIDVSSRGFELFTSQIEFADGDEKTPARAVVKIKLINAGSNSKHLMWKPSTMSKIAYQFRGVPFRYDLNGQNEGSHTRDKLSSPFYDVGWTYSDNRGAWYDDANKCIWVQGEVTHPEVVEKLKRQTSDGKREINYASMGAMMKPEDTMCSICNKSPFGSCNHIRGEEYHGETCNMVPLGISKALHVALTNDPADKIAEIAEAIFQDMAERDMSAKDSPVAPALNIPSPDTDIRAIVREVLEQMLSERSKKSDSEEGSMTKKKIEVAEAKEVEKNDKKEDVLDEKKEEKVEEKKEAKEEKSEKVDNPAEEKAEVKKEEKEEKKEKAEEKKDEKMEAAESLAVKAEKEEKKPDKEDKEEEKKELKEEKIESAESKTPKDEEEDDDDDDEDDEESFKIKGPAEKKKPTVETQDMVQSNKMVVETADSVYAEKYRSKLMVEVADSYVALGKADNRDAAVSQLRGKSIEQLELYQDALSGIVVQSSVKKTSAPVLVAQDNAHMAKKFAGDVPEYGGTKGKSVVELQDMSASDRRSKFGDYGAFDVCFNPQNAPRYRKA